MSQHLSSRNQAYKAEADLSANQYHFVKDGTADRTIVLAGAGEGFGILMTDPKLGDMAEVALTGGNAEVVCGGTVAKGDLLKSDANGEAVVANVANDLALARAIEAGVAGDVIEVERVFVRIHV